MSQHRAVDIDVPMQELPNVAVLVAAYNGADYLKGQLDSIVHATNVRAEIFMSLDSSRDASIGIIESYKAIGAVNLLKVIPPSGGAAANFFRLIADTDFSSHDYISFSDQDDIWHPDKLSRACQRLQRDNAAGYSSNVCAFWPDGSERLIDKAQPEKRWDYLFESRGPGCTFVLSRELALELQAFVRANREDLKHVSLHDWFIYAFARSRGYKWSMDAEPSMMYRQHGANEVGVNVGWQAAMWRVRKTLSGWLVEQARLIARLTGESEEPFVRATLFSGRLGLLRLAVNAGKCRRKTADQLFFAFSCVVLAIFGDKKS